MIQILKVTPTFFRFLHILFLLQIFSLTCVGFLFHFLIKTSLLCHYRFVFHVMHFILNFESRPNSTCACHGFNFDSLLYSFYDSLSKLCFNDLIYSRKTTNSNFLCMRSSDTKSETHDHCCMSFVIRLSITFLHGEFMLGLYNLREVIQIVTVKKVS